MYSKILLASTLLATSVLADGYGGGGGDKSSWSGNGWPSSDSSNSECCNGGSWGDWQPGSSPQSAAPQGELVVQIVSVSDASGSLKYYPDNIQAAPGTVVQFQFHPKNHTVTESSFAEPCKPLAANLTSSIRPGLKSGFVPVTGQESTTPVYNVLINDTKPIWLYCGQGPHCQKGMSMVINQNATSGKTIEAYQAAAAALPLPPSANSTTGTPPYGAPPGIPSAAPSVVAAPPPPGIGVSTSTTEVLPPPTPVAGVTTTSAVVQPATFTGAASRQDVYNVGSFGGLVVAGLAALL